MALSKCCYTGFQWSGTPVGKEGKLANNPTYITGSNPDVAVLLVHDLFGWKFPNLRLLADHFASEINATVYMPDLYVLPAVSVSSVQLSVPLTLLVQALAVYRVTTT